MEPISIALETTICIFGLAYFTLVALMIKNRSETGKDKFFNLSYQFGIHWLLAPELYNEKGNHYRKNCLVVLIVGLTLIFSLLLAYLATGGQ